MDYISGPERTLVAVYAMALQKGDAHEGQVLVGTEIRRPDEPMPRSPHSVSAESARRETAAAAGFASATAETFQQAVRQADVPDTEPPKR
jgi:hypothetical protein